MCASARDPADKKPWILLSVLVGEMSIAEATQNVKVSEQSIAWWKAEFVKAEGLAGGRKGWAVKPGEAAGGRDRRPHHRVGRGASGGPGLDESANG